MLIRHPPEKSEANTEGAPTPAPSSLLPCLLRPEYYSNPSIEEMASMPEAALRQVDNLEIGRNGFGSVRWPGLTDVRRLDFDKTVAIEEGRLTLYPDREKPAVGEELNKEAVVTLHVKPSRKEITAKNMELLKARLAKISAEFGGRFISYDLEKWIFQVPHF